MGPIRQGKLTLTVFTHLQVIAQVDAVCNRVVRPCRKVHVTNGASRYHETRQHFRQVVRGNTIAEASVENGALP